LWAVWCFPTALHNEGTTTRNCSEGVLELIASPMNVAENRISFDIFIEGTQTYETKFYAFATPAMAAELHRWHGYRVRLNDDPNYPRILECIEEMLLPKSTAKGKNSQP
jgi:hypothetical protein